AVAEEDDDVLRASGHRAVRRCAGGAAAVPPLRALTVGVLDHGNVDDPAGRRGRTLRRGGTGREQGGEEGGNDGQQAGHGGSGKAGQGSERSAALPGPSLDGGGSGANP